MFEKTCNWVWVCQSHFFCFPWEVHRSIDETSQCWASSQLPGDQFSSDSTCWPTSLGVFVTEHFRHSARWYKTPWQGFGRSHDWHYDVTFHLLPLPLSLQSSYAPVRNRELPKEDNSFKGKAKAETRALLKVQAQLPEESKALWAVTIVADRFALISIYLSVVMPLWEEPAKRGDMCASKQIALNRMHFAMRIRMKCPKGQTDSTNRWQVSLRMTVSF